MAFLISDHQRVKSGNIWGFSRTEKQAGGDDKNVISFLEKQLANPITPFLRTCILSKSHTSCRGYYHCLFTSCSLLLWVHRRLQITSLAGRLALGTDSGQRPWVEVVSFTSCPAQWRSKSCLFTRELSWSKLWKATYNAGASLLQDWVTALLC